MSGGMASLNYLTCFWTLPSDIQEQSGIDQLQRTPQVPQLQQPKQRRVTSILLQPRAGKFGQLLTRLGAAWGAKPSSSLKLAPQLPVARHIAEASLAAERFVDGGLVLTQLYSAPLQCSRPLHSEACQGAAPIGADPWICTAWR